MLPQSESTYRALPPLAACAYAALMCLAAVADRGFDGIVSMLVLVFTAMTALGGVRRGQLTYLAERERAASLCVAAGAPVDLSYAAATSAVPLAVAARSRWLAPPAVALIPLLSGGRPQSALATALLLGSAPAAGVAARECVAHLAVAASGIRFPQYTYVAAGVGTGTLLHLTLTRWGSGRTPDSGATPSAYWVWGLVLAVVAWAGPMAARRLAHAVGSGRIDVVLPFAFPRGRHLPLPLACRLWQGLGRENASVILGLVALLTLLALNRDAVSGFRPTSLAPFQVAELGIFVLYGVAFVTSTLFQEPLRLATVWQRLPLLTLAGVQPAREIAGLATFIGSAVAIATGVAAAVLERAHVFPGVAWWVICAAVVVTAVAATSVTSVTRLQHGSIDAGRRSADLPAVELILSAFALLLPAAMAVGWSVETPAAPPVTTGAVAAALLVIALVSVLRLRLVVRGRVRKAMS